MENEHVLYLRLSYTLSKISDHRRPQTDEDDLDGQNDTRTPQMWPTFPDIRLTVEGKLRQNPQPRN